VRDVVLERHLKKGYFSRWGPEGSHSEGSKEKKEETRWDLASVWVEEQECGVKCRTSDERKKGGECRNLLEEML